MDINTIMFLVGFILAVNSVIGSVICLWRLNVDKRITDHKWSTLWKNGGAWGKTGIIFYGFSIAPIVMALMFAATFIVFFPVCWIGDKFFK